MTFFSFTMGCFAAEIDFLKPPKSRIFSHTRSKIFKNTAPFKSIKIIFSYFSLISRYLWLTKITFLKLYKTTILNLLWEPSVMKIC